MKNLYTLIALLLLVSSCKNIQEMVDKGEYDKAIIYAAEKLHGEENKKTKYVTALEEAFEKVTQKDLDQIAFLESSGDEGVYDRVYDIYAQIAQRQERIRPFLPLVSEDAYVASFRFIRTNTLMAETGKKASAYHYEKALASLEVAKLGDKLAARRAYDRLDRIARYNSSYKEIDRLRTEALDLGQTRVLVQFEDRSFGYLPWSVEENMLDLDFYNLESRWIGYYYSELENVEMDLLANIYVQEFDLSREREEVNTHRDEAKVEDGFVWVEKPYTKSDTISPADVKTVKVKEKVFKTVYAVVHDVRREKSAYVEGGVRITDLRTGQKIKNRSHEVSANFEDYGFYYEGDARAICGKHVKGIDHIADFPSDRDLAFEATEGLKAKITNDLLDLVY